MKNALGGCLAVLAIGLLSAGCQQAVRPGPERHAIACPVCAKPAEVVKTAGQTSVECPACGTIPMECSASACMVPTKCPSCGRWMGMQRSGDRVTLYCAGCGRSVDVAE
jgi:hypothetical protein